MARRMTSVFAVTAVVLTLAAARPSGAAPARSAVRARSSATHAPAAPSPSAASKSAGPRRLEDVKIEGEIPVPQVLFVTAREQRRLLACQHHRYLRSSRELAEGTPLPRWVTIPQGTPTPAPEPSR